MKRLKIFSKKIANFQTVLLLSLVYVVVVPIFALFSRKSDEKSKWNKWKLKSDSIEDLKRQF